jgi:hypothetical protein
MTWAQRPSDFSTNQSPESEQRFALGKMGDMCDNQSARTLNKVSRIINGWNFGKHYRVQ